MKVCHVFELTTPTPLQIHDILRIQTPVIKQDSVKNNMESLIDYIQGDLRKCFAVLQWIEKEDEEIWTNMIRTFCTKMFNEDSKRITRRILDNQVIIEDHCNIINETDRTIVALLWHENIVDCLQKSHHLTCNERFHLYHTILKNICFADYIDRITFQNQIWQFNEMSSLIKTMYNNKLFHETVGSSVAPLVAAPVATPFVATPFVAASPFVATPFVAAPFVDFI